MDDVLIRVERPLDLWARKYQRYASAGMPMVTNDAAKWMAKLRRLGMTAS
jgi:hypothetical protein